MKQRPYEKDHAEKRLTNSEIKQQIFEKLTSRFANDCHMPFCAELNPDIIVIPADQTFLFEPQNRRASQLLHLYSGLSLETAVGRERICAHPCESRKIIEKLRIAGLHVVC